MCFDIFQAEAIQKRLHSTRSASSIDPALFLVSAKKIKTPDTSITMQSWQVSLQSTKARAIQLDQSNQRRDRATNELSGINALLIRSVLKLRPQKRMLPNSPRNTSRLAMLQVISSDLRGCGHTCSTPPPRKRNPKIFSTKTCPFQVIYVSALKHVRQLSFTKHMICS